MQFGLGDVERDKLQQWLAQHRQFCHLHLPGHGGAIGGSLTYSFTPNGLGTVVVVQCACGASTDLTDYDSW